mgnify:CR=1 FL=1
MEEGTEKREENVNQRREEIFSQAVRAGKRTYFFDVKATRRNDYYLTITESKKRFNKDGKSYYEKHKVFLYKEDFDKFIDGLTTAVDFIKDHNAKQAEQEENATESKNEDQPEAAMAENFTDIDFEDLDEKQS